MPMTLKIFPNPSSFTFPQSFSEAKFIILYLHSYHANQPGQLNSPWTSKSLVFRRYITSDQFKDLSPSQVHLVYEVASLFLSRNLTAHHQLRRASLAGPAQGESDCAGPTLKPTKRTAKNDCELAHCGFRLNANTMLHLVCLS